MRQGEEIKGAERKIEGVQEREGAREGGKKGGEWGRGSSFLTLCF